LFSSIQTNHPMNQFLLSLAAIAITFLILSLTWIGVILSEDLLFEHSPYVIAIFFSIPLIAIYALVNLWGCLFPIKIGVKSKAYLVMVLLLFTTNTCWNFYRNKSLTFGHMPNYVYLIIMLLYVLLPLFALLNFKKGYKPLI